MFSTLCRPNWEPSLLTMDFEICWKVIKRTEPTKLSQLSLSRITLWPLNDPAKENVFSGFSFLFDFKALSQV